MHTIIVLNMLHIGIYICVCWRGWEAGDTRLVTPLKRGGRHPQIGRKRNTRDWLSREKQDTTFAILSVHSRANVTLLWVWRIIISFFFFFYSLCFWFHLSTNVQADFHGDCHVKSGGFWWNISLDAFLDHVLLFLSLFSITILSMSRFLR